MRKPFILRLLLFLLRIGFGLFFLTVGLLKITQLSETADFITRSRLLPQAFSLPLACIGVGMELVVGVCLLFRLAYRGATLWGSVMTATFLFLYVQGWIRGLDLTCNCLGSPHSIVNYPTDTGLRVLLLGAMGILLWDSRQPDSGLWKFRKFDFSEEV